jgi:tryptophan synthase alpha chain
MIHAAGTTALETGATVGAVVQVAGELAREGPPVVLMCYSNQILARGVERFLDMLVEAGVSGLIVPDLPLEEADAALTACDERGLALVPLLAPNTPDERLELIGARASGFVYVVSLKGTTGERASLADALPALIERARARTTVPVAVGFGIGTPDQARAAADAGADGVIIGSRLVRAAADEPDPAEAVGALVREFAEALGTSSISTRWA